MLKQEHKAVPTWYNQQMYLRRYAGRRAPFLASRIIIAHPIKIRFYSEQRDERPRVDPTEKLNQWREIAVTNGRARLETWSNTVGQQLALLGSKLNHLTGYDLVEELKQQVVEQGMEYI